MQSLTFNYFERRSESYNSLFELLYCEILNGIPGILINTNLTKRCTPT